MLWVKVEQNEATTLIGAIYHPPKPIYQTVELLNHIEETIIQAQQNYPGCSIIFAGDLNAIPDSEIIIRTGLKSLVMQPTRGNNCLDRVYVSDIEYNGVKVQCTPLKCTSVKRTFRLSAMSGFGPDFLPITSMLINSA